MSYLLIAIGLVTAGLLLSGKLRGKTKQTARTAAGICQAALDQTVRKQHNKQKALDYLVAHGPASNSELRKHLGVSRNTITNYMDELESTDQVEQDGAVGTGVRYRLKS